MNIEYVDRGIDLILSFRGRETINGNGNGNSVTRKGRSPFSREGNTVICPATSPIPVLKSGDR